MRANTKLNGRRARRFFSSFAAVGLCGFCASTWSAERAPQVRVATTGNHSERVQTLPITRKQGAKRHVVMSLGPSRLPDLTEGDRVEISAELQVTTNCRIPGPRCRGPSYGYSPRIRAKLVLAPSARAKRAPMARAISGVKRETCTQKRPQYEHHCVLVFTRAGFDVGNPSHLPCNLDDCHVNLVADAHHPSARAGELVMVGGLTPDGKIRQDRGRINAVRYRDVVAGDFASTQVSRPRKRRLAPNFERSVVISKRLDGLERNDQLAVRATLRTAISHLPYAVRTSVYLILAESPRATRPGAFVTGRASNFGEISENNGSNCTTPPGTCTYRKVGVIEMRRDSTDAQDRDRPLFVNVVTVLGPKVLSAERGDRVRIRKAAIYIQRFPRRLRG